MGFRFFRELAFCVLQGCCGVAADATHLFAEVACSFMSAMISTCLSATISRRAEGHHHHGRSEF